MKNLIILVTLFVAPVWAQSTCADIDDVVAKHLQALDDNKSNDAAHADSTASLVAELKRFATAHPAESWACPYPKTQADHAFNAPVSADGKLRIYSWDTMTGGTMRYYFSLLQYQDENGNTHIVEANAEAAKDDTWGDGNSGFADDIFTLDLGAHGSAYFLVEYHQGDNRSKAYSATLYRVNGSKLEELPWIIENDQDTASIGFDYDAMQDPLPQTYPFMQYDTTSKTLSFPETLPGREELNAIMTDRRVQYRFDGERFVIVDQRKPQ